MSQVKEGMPCRLVLCLKQIYTPQNISPIGYYKVSVSFSTRINRNATRVLTRNYRYHILVHHGDKDMELWGLHWVYTCIIVCTDEWIILRSHLGCSRAGIVYY